MGPFGSTTVLSSFHYPRLILLVTVALELENMLRGRERTSPAALRLCPVEFRTW